MSLINSVLGPGSGGYGGQPNQGAGDAEDTGSTETNNATPPPTQASDGEGADGASHGSSGGSGAQGGRNAGDESSGSDSDLSSTGADAESAFQANGSGDDEGAYTSASVSETGASETVKAETVEADAVEDDPVASFRKFVASVEAEFVKTEAEAYSRLDELRGALHRLENGGGDDSIAELMKEFSPPGGDDGAQARAPKADSGPKLMEAYYERQAAVAARDAYQTGKAVFEAA